VPRKRLFTIFILNLQLFAVGGFNPPGYVHPGRSP